MRWLFLILLGCGDGPAFYFSGRDVILVIADEGIKHTRISTPGGDVNGQDMIREACAMWNGIGTKFRTEEDLGDEVPTGVLHIHPMILPIIGERGYYTTPADGIRLDMNYWGEIGLQVETGSDQERCIVHILAHEMGHSIGLSHNSDCLSLMGGAPYCALGTCDGLTPVDIEAYNRKWP